MSRCLSSRLLVRREVFQNNLQLSDQLFDPRFLLWTQGYNRNENRAFAYQYMLSGPAAAGLTGRRIAWFYEQLNRLAPTIGRRTGYAAALAEANGAEQGLAVLDAIDQDAVSDYQPYWAVRAHLLQLLEKGPEAQHAYDRAIGLAEDPAVREFLIQKRG
jgi:tetratricopeptide (TPR) repeat protein